MRRATISRAPCARKTASYLFIRERRSRALRTCWGRLRTAGTETLRRPGPNRRAAQPC
ncbi:hypothetical protein BDIM_27600 [Brevundimonas diminuta ATCC 11568]|nr:hypothetical protein BDIM_27600 [Brevundimonas diminuta ATCC 11568]